MRCRSHSPRTRDRHHNGGQSLQTPMSILDMSPLLVLTLFILDRFQEIWGELESLKSKCSTGNKKPLFMENKS